MPRRGNGEGSITHRPDGRWEARISLPGGRRKSYFGKTRQEVARKLTEALRDVNKGLPIVGERQTLAQFSSEWIETIRHTISPTTVQKYEQHLRLYVLPTLGSTALSKVTAQQIQALYTARLAAGLSPSTVRMTHSMLHHLLEDAVRLGLVQRNVAGMVNHPRNRHREMLYYTPAEARKFLAAAQGNRLEALFILALSTGMRQGELLGLKWQDVDLENGVLQVRATLKMVAGKPIVAEPKTPRSRRRIALTPLACNALRAHRARQLEERKLLGAAWGDDDLVFANTVGRLFDPASFNRNNFWPIIAKAGIQRIRFHDLRHTAATLLLLQGVHVKVVSEMLGHASVAITLERYSHVLPDMQREAASAMQRILGAPTEG